MEVKKYYLFNILPILSYEKYNNRTVWKLFKFIPLISTKTIENSTGIKLLGIPIIKIKETNHNNDITYKILCYLSKLKTKRNIVLIMDNIFEPLANIEDNATFFKHLYNSDPKKLEPYYIITKSSPYYKELKSKYKNRIIPWRGTCNLKFKLKMLSIMPKLKYICDSFQAITALELDFDKLIKNSPYIYSIFTQHGVNYFKPDFVTCNIYGFNVFDSVLTSNEQEKQLFIKRGKFPSERIIQNGLFRWDKLQNLSDTSKQKSIFVFFTKRDYLNKVKSKGNCTYIKSIIEILNNSTLNDVLKKSNTKLKLGLHHTVAEYIGQYINNSVIDILSEDDILNAKKESSLLITDYSSMCFEFFIQNKPVIFYHIDDSADCKLYGSLTDVIDPYNNKENDLFNIAENQEKVVELIIKYINNGFTCENDVIEKQNKFFYYKNDFCKRFENYLIEHLEDKK